MGSRDINENCHPHQRRYPAFVPSFNRPDQVPTPEESEKVIRALGGDEIFRDNKIKTTILVSPSLGSPAAVEGGKLLLNPITLHFPVDQIRIILEGHELCHLRYPDAEDTQVKYYTLHFLKDNVSLALHTEFLEYNSMDLVPEISWLDALKKTYYQPAKERGTIAFNPLLALDDPPVLNVFRQLIEKRYDVRVLSEIYGLGSVPLTLTHRDKKMTVHGFVDTMISFLKVRRHQDPHTIAFEFRHEFPNMARPPELDAIFDRYMKIKSREFDLQIVCDALPPDSIIADIGAGKNELGREILEFSDRVHLNVRFVVGTDVIDWREEKSMKNPRQLFFLQDSDIELPLSSGAYDAVILKWVLHHMSDRDQTEILKEARRILKPGGRLILFECLIADSRDPDLWRDFDKETRNPRSWPDGSFKGANVQLNEDFKNLSQEQQGRVHAVDDFFGHNLTMGRDRMPQPFTYLPVTALQKLMEGLDFTENRPLKRIFGSPPIMRMGPPSLRLVYEAAIEKRDKDDFVGPDAKWIMNP